MTIYSIDGLKKVYADRTVLDIKSLDLDEHGLYALLGPNGAGKTTLLNILAFLEKPTHGRMTCRGQPVQFTDAAMHQMRKEVVIVDQHPILFTTTVFHNVEFGLKVRKMSKTRRVRIVEEVLDLVDMRAFSHAQAHRLSGGETQRVALARALAVSPKVFLCDEPTANVDIENQESILAILNKINTEKKITIIFTTHDRAQAALLAQQTLMLNGGRLVPTSYENFFKADLINSADGSFRCHIKDRFTVPVAIRHINRPAGRIRVFIDPEKIAVKRKPQVGSAQTMIEGRVTSVSEENGRIRMVVDIGASVHVLSDQKTYLRHRFAVGDTVYLDVPNAAVHVY